MSQLKPEQGTKQVSEKKKNRNHRFPEYLGIHVTKEMLDAIPKLVAYYRTTNVTHAVRLLIEDKLAELQELEELEQARTEAKERQSTEVEVMENG